MTDDSKRKSGQAQPLGMKEQMTDTETGHTPRTHEDEKTVAIPLSRKAARSEGERRRVRRHARRRISIQLGKSLRAESGAVIASILSGAVSLAGICVYLAVAVPDWLESMVLFMSSGAIVAVPAVIAFIVGYSQLPQFLTAERFEQLVDQAQTGQSDDEESERRQGSAGISEARIRLGRRTYRVLDLLRRLVTTVALAVVYGYTIFLLSFVILYTFNDYVGFDPQHRYLVASVVFMSVITAYYSFVTGSTLTARHLSMLLPLFVIAGVGVAGITTPYQHWWTNNFSELGDNSTPAARLFNTTLILAGICVVIISYFAVYELIASRQQYLRWGEAIEDLPDDSAARLVLVNKVRNDRILKVRHFKARTVTLLVLLIASGVLLAGVGIFQYSEHPVLHNICGRGMTVPIGLLILLMPWLAPEFSGSFFFAGYVMGIACSASMVLWLRGTITLVNVEGLLWLLYLLWFILFARQAAALSQDRRENQLLYDALGVRTEQVESPLEARVVAPGRRQTASMREASRTGTSWSTLTGWPDDD